MPIGTGNPTESFINYSVSEGCAIIILHLYRILFIGLRMVADWPDEAVKKYLGILHHAVSQMKHQEQTAARLRNNKWSAVGTRFQPKVPVSL
jgi:hypothetical protein